MFVINSNVGRSWIEGPKRLNESERENVHSTLFFANRFQNKRGVFAWSLLLTLETGLGRLGQYDPEDEVTELAFGQDLPGDVRDLCRPSFLRAAFKASPRRPYVGRPPNHVLGPTATKFLHRHAFGKLAWE